MSSENGKNTEISPKIDRNFEPWLGLGVRVALKVGAQTLDFILSTTSSYLINVLFLLIKIIIKKVTLVSGLTQSKGKSYVGSHSLVLFEVRMVRLI